VGNANASAPLYRLTRSYTGNGRRFRTLNVVDDPRWRKLAVAIGRSGRRDIFSASQRLTKQGAFRPLHGKSKSDLANFESDKSNSRISSSIRERSARPIAKRELISRHSIPNIKGKPAKSFSGAVASSSLRSGSRN
jgi:hypothetical protein